MPTITFSTDKLHELYDKHKHHFSSGFHDFLWQIIVNKVYKDRNMIVYAECAKQDIKTWQLCLVDYNMPGYQSLAVYFKEEYSYKEYDKMQDVCIELSGELFGTTEDLWQTIIASSMGNKTLKEGDEVEILEPDGNDDHEKYVGETGIVQGDHDVSGAQELYYTVMLDSGDTEVFSRSELKVIKYAPAKP